jgi:hypothetical protein
MSFINWGSESPKQKENRRRFEEEQMLYEQAIRFSRTTGSMAGAAGSGSVADKPPIELSAHQCTIAGFKIRCSSGEEPVKISVDWGDDFKEDIIISDSIDYTYSHEYGAGSQGEYTILIKSKQLDRISKFTIDGGVTNWNKFLSGITGLPLLINLVELELTYTYLTNFDTEAPLAATLNSLYLNENYDLNEFNPTYPLPATLSELIILSGSIDSFNLTHPLPASVQSLSLNGNGMTSFNLNIEPNNNLLFLRLYGNQLTQFTSDLSAATNLYRLELDGNQMTLFNPSAPLPNSLRVLSLSQNQLASFNPTYQLPPLNTLNLGSNRLTTFGYSHPWPQYLTYLYLQNNLLTSFNPTYRVTSAEVFQLSDNMLTSFDYSHVLPSNIQHLSLYGNRLTSFSLIQPFPANGRSIYVYGNNQLTSVDLSNVTNPTDQLNSVWFAWCKLPSSEINEILIHCNTIMTTSKSRQIRLDGQSPAAPPSGAGLSAKTSLQAKGVYVYTD